MDVGGWVPQVFYDLIGRVVPGAFLLGLCFLLFMEPASATAISLFVFKKPGIPLTVLVLAGVLAAYMTGTLLGAIGFAIWHGEWTARASSKLKVEYPEAGKPDQGTAYMYDAILFHEPPAGARLVKLRAEQHMCRVLIVGTLTLLVVYCWSHWPLPVLLRHLPPVGGLVLIAAASYLFNVHLTLRSRLLLMNYWDLLGEPEGGARQSQGGAVGGAQCRPKRSQAEKPRRLKRIEPR